MNDLKCENMIFTFYQVLGSNRLFSEFFYYFSSFLLSTNIFELSLIWILKTLCSVSQEFKSSGKSEKCIMQCMEGSV